MKRIIHKRRCMVAASVIAAMFLAACSGSEMFQGTELNPSRSAPLFSLQNQFNEQIALTDYNGKAILLTFLYTSCSDICPVVASQLRETHEMLGDDADDVAFLVISVDPDGDSIEQAYAFSEKWRMAHNWDFLVGDWEQLSPIWKAYYIDPSPNLDFGWSNSRAPGEGPVKRRGGALQKIANEQLVAHSAPVYLMDREGTIRVLLTPPLNPTVVTHDLRLLLK